MIFHGSLTFESILLLLWLFTNSDDDPPLVVCCNKVTQLGKVGLEGD